ncbi:MAG: MlaE family ABC transporter permease [Candidatus Cyclobacteriaceae bacterium M2_1C_046]
MQPIELLPSRIKNAFYDFGGLAAFTGRFFREFFKKMPDLNELLNQCYRVGNNSLFLVGLTAFIIGVVMTLQILPTMRDVGAESWMPATISVSIIREIGPVLTALITAGKVASSIGSEVGSMKVTEQIDAMTVSGVNPFHYLINTRVLACTIMLPILVFYADAIALFGSYLALNLQEEYSLLYFLRQAVDILLWVDIIGSTIKTIFFGLAIGLVACYKGYHTSGGTAGVGQAANSAVVVASISIFVIDLVAVQITQFFMPI